MTAHPSPTQPHCHCPSYKLKATQRIDKKNKIFLIQGTRRINKLFKTSRNMVVLQHQGEITLINPIRLNANGEKSFQQLGVQRVICLGSQNREAARYYKDAFGAQVYAPCSSFSNQDNPIDSFLDESTVLPFPRSRVFIFRNAKVPEAALLVDNLLITAESLQDQRRCPFFDTPVRVGGYLDPPLVINPRWTSIMSQDKLSVRDDFERLLKLDFTRLVGASGAFVPGYAKEETVMAVDAAFPAM